jgi:hypothetical protein
MSIDLGRRASARIGAVKNRVAVQFSGSPGRQRAAARLVDICPEGALIVTAAKPGLGMALCFRLTGGRWSRERPRLRHRWTYWYARTHRQLHCESPQTCIRGGNNLGFPRTHKRGEPSPTEIERCHSRVSRWWPGGRGELSNRSTSERAVLRSPSDRRELSDS